MKACSINLQQVAPENAVVSVQDHGLLYGDGVFEGLRFYQGRVFRLGDHLVRLYDSARVIELDIPASIGELEEAVLATITASGLTDGYIRLIVTRGVGPLGIDPKDCAAPQIIIIVDQLQLMDPTTVQRGAKLIVASTRRLSPDQLDPRIKSLNYLNNLMARLEANAAGADEAIMLNQNGRVAEGTADNVFVVKSGRLLTPPAHEGSLAGITRQSVLDAAAQCAISSAEVPLSTYDLYTADELFLTGTGAELIPVREVAGRTIPVVRGKIFCQIEAEFQAMTTGNLARIA